MTCWISVKGFFFAIDFHRFDELHKFRPSPLVFTLGKMYAMPLHTVTLCYRNKAKLQQKKLDQVYCRYFRPIYRPLCHSGFVTEAFFFSVIFCIDISPSSRYALLDTADLPLTIRETTVDYQVEWTLSSIKHVKPACNARVTHRNYTRFTRVSCSSTREQHYPKWMAILFIKN